MHTRHNEEGGRSGWGHKRAEKQTGMVDVRGEEHDEGGGWFMRVRVKDCERDDAEEGCSE